MGLRAKLEPGLQYSNLGRGSESSSLRRPRSSLERFLPTALAATVICSAMASSVEPHLNRLGHPTRWLGLLAVAVVAGWLVIRGRLLGRPTLGEALLFSFGLLAFLSATWSPWPWTSFAHSAAFAIVVVAASAIGRVYRGRRDFAPPLAGLAVGAGVVGVAGLVLAVLHPLDAFQLAPFRYRGVGQNPNTVPLLAALAIPLLLCLRLTARNRPRRRLAVIGIVVLVQTIFLSASRGSILAATLAVIIVVSLVKRAPRWRVKAFAVLTAVLLYGLFSGAGLASIIHIKEPSSHASVTRHAGAPPRLERSSVVSPCSRSAPAIAKNITPARNARQGRLSVVTVRAPKAAAVIALLVPRLNTLFTGSGRLAAWRAGMHLGMQRPLGGFGFGTEDLAFCRASHALLSVFEGAFVENSYIGIFLQLGLAGVVLFLVLVLVVIVRGVALVRHSRRDSATWNVGLVAVVVAGLVQAIFQSYVYSPGNIATLTFLVSLALLMNRRASSAFPSPMNAFPERVRRTRIRFQHLPSTLRTTK